MEEIIEAEGIPVIVRKGEELKTVRVVFRNRKRGRDAPLSKMTPLQKQALKNYIDGGCKPGTKTKSAEDAGYAVGSGASKAINRIMARKEIVDAIEEKCGEGGAAERVANVIVDATEALHPLAKGEKPDHMARLKGAQEINKIKGVYPSQKIEVEEKGVVIHLTPRDAVAMEKYKRLRNATGRDPF